MRILYATCSPASYMAPPRLSLEQINCGPDWLDADIGGYVTSRNTPLGDYDLAAVAAKLPADQQPDAVVCLVDASWRSTPRNLAAFKCPKVLLVADTHHLNTPISGMIRYAQQEAFDRIVLLYDRHHFEFFQAAGLKQLYWFPGLTFPHDDKAIAAARSAATRETRIAFVGQTGICHPRRIQMLSQLHAHNLPLSVKSMSQREGLNFYGSSLVGFNSSLNGDLNLRVFETLASGAMLLTDALAPAAGLNDLWQNGRDLLTYASTAELVEKARHAIAHPGEAKTIGAAGATWFDTHFSEQVRRTAFQKLVSDGVAPTVFELPPAAKSASKAAGIAQQARLIAGYEYVQELHRNLDKVVVALDESVPEEFVRQLATLPRIEVKRGPVAKAGRVDVMVIGRQSFNSPALVAATHVWAWEDVEAERVNLVRRCSSMGLALVRSDLQVFSRQKINTHTNDGAVALVRLEQGGYEDALHLARKELEKNPRSADAMLVMLELAQEKGNEAVAQTALAKLREIAPHHPRFKQLAAQPVKAGNSKRGTRLLKVARALLEQQKWADAGKLAKEVLTFEPQSAEAHFILGCMVAHGSEPEQGIGLLGRATQLDASRVEYWRHLAAALRAQKRTADTLGAMLHVVSMVPDELNDQLALVSAALDAGHGAIACEALGMAARLHPNHPLIQRWTPVARQLALQCNYEEPRDLLLSHVEVTRLQGTGVLIERFFPDARSFVTVRSRTLYKEVVNFGGVHFAMDLPGLSECGRKQVLQRLLAPFQIRRILCVPFYASDFMHAVAAREITGAPLCTYVMDDQVLHSREVSTELAKRVFSASDVRLAISPEMIAEYSTWFGCTFGLLPPVVTNRDNEVPNHWTPSRENIRHCVMVGNIWSAKQFEQVRAFSRAAQLRIDWFGNNKVSWLPQDRAVLEADGIYCQGFLPESELAHRLANYPFVVLPSGTLDGSEDNEWLTRLSLPSRMVFILTKTLTPMLVLGSPKTAAARFVEQFGLGLSSNYDPAEAQDKITEITSPTRRAELLANARKVAPAFLMPDCGEWLWRCLAAKSPQPTPFDPLYPNLASSSRAVAAPDAGGEANAAAPTLDGVEFDRNLKELVAKLSDHALHDRYLPPEEPRQRADVRGVVLFLHDALLPLGPVSVRLLAIERLSQQVKNHRGVLVTWAELLEQAGNMEEAAAKARQALSLYYDDVYTQTLFVRCVGDVNHHADAKDRFCPRPFENFEIYKDGSVFPCNCTQVPFPIGNAHTQTKEEIWQSPIAKAVRASILDGSFRFCSPMTCWRRFDLPKRGEQPAKWAELQRIGVDGIQPPKHLNLSYDLSCNLSCPSCRNATIMATKPERDKLDRVRDNIVLPLLSNKIAETVYITGSGDAFGSPHFRGILKELCDPKYSHVQITLGTNGQLITDRLWEEFKPLHKQFNDITVSIDGATPETYERLRRGSTWEKLHRTMGILATARRAGAIRRVMVNMVVQQDNFLEMRPLIGLCKGWAVDGIRFYRIRQWGNVVPGAFMDSDVANPLHPRYPELMTELAHPDFGHKIVDRYDMFELIDRAQTAAREAEVLELKRITQSDTEILTVVASTTAEPALVAVDPTEPTLADYQRKLDVKLATAVLPRTLNLQPIDVCNSRCIMCNIWKDGEPAKLSLDELATFLRHPFFAEVRHVGITGGEPTLRKDLFEIYQMLPECLPNLKGASFITHGMQTERAVEVYTRVHVEYKRRGLTFEGMVSLDGVGEVHDRVRGRKGAFESASRTLLQLKNRGVNVMAACTIIRSNVYELHDLLDWGRANEIYVRFRIAEFIRRLYNENCSSEIRNFTASEIRHLVSFLHVLITGYEKNEVILRTYRSDLSILTGGKRLIGCPYKSGAAVNVGSQGTLASCAPKGAALAMRADVLQVHAALETSRAAVAKDHCGSCIHDYHDDWSASTLAQIKSSERWAHELYDLTEDQLTTPEAAAEAVNFSVMKKVMLVGWYGTETAGDIAILRGIIAEYLEQNPDLRFQVLSLYPYYTRTTIAEWPRELQAKVEVSDYASEAAYQGTTTCDAIVMAGGPLMDIPETRKILCLFKRFADLRKPRLIEGCGIGPLNNPDFRWHVCRIARLATRITVRDSASRDYLRLLAIRKEVAVRHDPAVAYLRSLSVRYHGAGSGVIRCFLRELTSEYPQALTPEQATQQLTEFLTRVLEWYPEHKVELWAMHHFPIGNDDRLFAKQLVQRVGSPRLKVEWEPRIPAEVFGAMASAEFCICMRFHSCVFAAEVGAPFLAIDYTAGGKIRGFLEDVGQQHRLTSLGHLSQLDHASFTAKLQPAALVIGGAVDDTSSSPLVLHIVQRITGGGGARAAMWLARYSSQLGGPRHRVVSLAAADDAGRLVAQQQKVELVDAPTWPELHALMASADIVLVHWWNHPDLARLFRRELPPMRLALWLHVGGYHAPQLLTPQMIQFADLSVACSSHTYAHPVFTSLPEETRRERTAMVIAGADFERLRGVSMRKHDGFRVGYIGALDPVKMHSDYIAMSSAVNIPDARFVVCGSGNSQWLVDQAEKLGTRDRFEIQGVVEDIRSVIETLDVYGYPLCAETYAAAELNLQEVMYAGVPVVAFPHGGIGRLIVNGETGILVNSAEEYARAIERLHKDPAGRARLGANAAAFARKHWGAENTAREFNQQFERLLQTPKRLRRWTGSNVEHDPVRELAISPGARMFIDSVGEAGAAYIVSLTAPVIEDRIRADEVIARQSHLMRYNGVQTFREAWPKESHFHLWAGVGIVREGNGDLGSRALAEARQRGLGDWRVAWYLAQHLVATGKVTEAAPELSHVLQAARAFAPAQAMLRRLTGGPAAVNKSTPSAPAAGVMKATLAQVTRLLQQGQLKPAREALQTAMDSCPGNLDLMEVVAELDCRMGRLDSAKRLHAAILAQAPNRATPRFRAIQAAVRAKTAGRSATKSAVSSEPA